MTARVSSKEIAEKALAQFKFTLSHNIPTYVELYNHVLKYGIADLEFIIEEDIEKAVITEARETRGRKKVVREVHQ